MNHESEQRKRQRLVKEDDARPLLPQQGAAAQDGGTGAPPDPLLEALQRTFGTVHSMQFLRFRFLYFRLLALPRVQLTSPAPVALTAGHSAFRHSQEPAIRAALQGDQFWLL